MGQPIFSIDTARLEQPADVFYERLNNNEGVAVREIVGDVSRFMETERHVPYLIAGVGGILRFLEPEVAKDIDLAVVGLRPRCKPDEKDFVAFTRTVKEFFDRFAAGLTLSYREFICGMGSGSLVGSGSGPFWLLDEEFRGGTETERIEGRTHLERFGFYKSKGWQVKFNGARPIDIQFSAIPDCKEWSLNQYSLRDPTGDPRAANAGTLFEVPKDERFYYSVLAQKF
ncbi:MAG: hypothetical protein KJ600_03140 [Nanoarchaeota archaeon]|nr:hypothetical protein [Nanoarchaeota archaeon]MBU1103522.1 hypothetical protein [Nanoarchaeota archaeon]